MEDIKKKRLMDAVTSETPKGGIIFNAEIVKLIAIKAVK